MYKSFRDSEIKKTSSQTWSHCYGCIVLDELHISKKKNMGIESMKDRILFSSSLSTYTVIGIKSFKILNIEDYNP